MPEQKYYYIIDSATELGRQFRSFWNRCIKAERAAHDYCKRIGAETFYENQMAFAGGVGCVSFPEGAKVDKRVWRSLGRDGDGLEQWEPNVEHRDDVLRLRNVDQHLDTSCRNRIYSHKILSWPVVTHFHSPQEWAALYNITLTGEKENDLKVVNETLKDAVFVRYTLLYVKGYDPSDPKTGQKMPSWVRQAISYERSRRKLPVVTVESFYTMMQGQLPVSPDGKPVIIRESTPTFFEWYGRYYVACSRPCTHPDLEESNQYTYNTKRQTLLLANKLASEANDDDGKKN